MFNNPLVFVENWTAPNLKSISEKKMLHLSHPRPQSWSVIEVIELAVSYDRNFGDTLRKTLNGSIWTPWEKQKRPLVPVSKFHTIIYFHVTSLPFYLCRWLSKANDKVNYSVQNIYMYMIVTLEVVYDHVGKCRKLALCYFIQINLILFCLTTIWKSEFQAKSYVIETEH